MRVGPQYAGIDGYDGEPDVELPPLLSAADVERLETERNVAAGGASTPVAVEQTLVWRPCDQSHSPYQPFYVVNRGGFVEYVRVDGAVFTELTDYGGGA
jgi:hypothetical protein